MSYPNAIRNAQRVLRARGGYTGAIDGDPGALSLTAARSLNYAFPKHWPPARVVIAAAQLCLGAEAGPVDGLYGPQTDAAYQAWKSGPFTRPHDEPEAGIAATRWPPEADLRAWFGAPGNAACTAGKVVVPWPMVAAWDTRAEITRLTCHAEVAGSVARVLEEVADTHSEAQIRDLGLHLYGGGYAYRRKRGGAEWSTHAYGIALDWDPVRNGLRMDHTKARLAREDAAGWWAAWEAEGWTSLGRAKDFDWMHVQAAGL